MLAISLMRMGAKGKPFYRLVVKEKRSKRDGAYLENVGTYNPMLDPAEVILKHDRIQYWIGVGAQPTDTVKSLIKNNPVQTEEEQAVAAEARAAKMEAEDQAKAEAKNAEAEKLEGERADAERAETEKAEADAAAVEAEAEVAQAAEADEPVATDTPNETETAPETSDDETGGKGGGIAV